MAQRPIGVRTRSTSAREHGGGFRILRSSAAAHMKELVNYGQTSNRRFRIRRR